MTLDTIKVIMILLEYLIVKKLSTNKKPNKGIMVNMAGYMVKASIKSPLSKKEIARWAPQPGHSMPNNFLLRQGSM